MQQEKPNKTQQLVVAAVTTVLATGKKQIVANKLYRITAEVAAARKKDVPPWAVFIQAVRDLGYAITKGEVIEFKEKKKVSFQEASYHRVDRSLDKWISDLVIAAAALKAKAKAKGYPQHMRSALADARGQLVAAVNTVNQAAGVKATAPDKNSLTSG